jgi:hypothetical protein
MITMCPRTDCTKKPMLAHVRVCPGRLWWRAVTATEHVIRWLTAAVVVGVAAVAAVASYEHAAVGIAKWPDLPGPQVSQQPNVDGQRVSRDGLRMIQGPLPMIQGPRWM